MALEKTSVDVSGICHGCTVVTYGTHNIKAGKFCFLCGHFWCNRHFGKHRCEEIN